MQTPPCGAKCELHVGLPQSEHVLYARFPQIWHIPATAMAVWCYYAKALFDAVCFHTRSFLAVSSSIEIALSAYLSAFFCMISLVLSSRNFSMKIGAFLAYSAANSE